jgi:GntR family transcriptional regulator
MHEVHPPYLQLKEDIVTAIHDGEYKTGDLLPSQRALSEKYGMSHMTVRRAINELISEGIIYSIQGKGIYVAQQKLAYDYGSLQGLDIQLERFGMKPSTKVLDAKVMMASTMIARTLQIEVAMPVVYLQRLRFADGKPISLHSVFLPSHLVPGILEKENLKISLFKTLREDYGLTLAGSTNNVSAEIASEEVTKMLEGTHPTAVIVKEQITYLDTGEIIEYSLNYARGDIYSVCYEEGVVPRKREGELPIS